MSERRSWIRTLAQVAGFIVATGVPLLVLIGRYTRHARVAVRFVMHELGALLEWAWPGVALTVVLVLALVLAAARLNPGVGASLRQLVFAYRQRRSVPSIGTAVAAIALAVLLARAELARYRLYSEVHFPRQAMRQAAEADYAGAMQTCRLYIELFPQRASGGAFPDPVCTPLLRLGDAMTSLATYIESRHIEERVDRRMAVPAARDARRRALELAYRWAGLGEARIDSAASGSDR